jgi:hypothetical protein
MISLHFIQVAEILVRGYCVSKVSVCTLMSVATAPSPHDPFTVSLDPPTVSSTTSRTSEFHSEVWHYFESLASCSSWSLNRNQGTLRCANSLPGGFNLRAMSDSVILLFGKKYLPLPRKLWG